MTDILDDLRSMRPDLDRLGHQWSVAERAELALSIIGDETGPSTRLPHPPRGTRTRLIAGSVLVAAATVAAVTVPSLLPSGSPGSANPAAAAALHLLARVVADTPADTAGAGQFIHQVVQEQQFGVFTDGGAPTRRSARYETWTGARGQEWQRSGGQTEFFPAHDGDTAYIASMPTDPDELQEYLRSHVSGSDSTDEAVFVAIGDLLRGGNVPDALRSAMETVLAHTDHVRLGPARVDWRGRPVEEFDFVDDSQRPGTVESLFFDPHTAALLDERTTNTDGSYDRHSVLVSDVVDSVPPTVLRAAVRQK